MFVIKLADTPRYPPIYFKGFSNDSLCPVRYGPLTDALRIGELQEAINIQFAIHDKLPQSKWLIELEAAHG